MPSIHCGRTISKEERGLIATVAMMVLTGAILSAQDTIHTITGMGEPHTSSIGFEQLCYKELPTRSTLFHDIHSSLPPSEAHTDAITDKRKKRKLALRIMIEWSKALAANNLESSQTWESIAQSFVIDGKGDETTTLEAPQLSYPNTDEIVTLAVSASTGVKGSDSNPRVLLAVFLAFVSDMQKRLADPEHSSGAQSTFTHDNNEYDRNTARLSINSKSFATFMHLMALLEETEVQAFREELISIFSHIAIDGPSIHHNNMDVSETVLSTKGTINAQGVLSFLRYRVAADSQPTLSMCSLPAPHKNNHKGPVGTSTPRHEPTCTAVKSVVVESSSSSNPIESRPQMQAPPPLAQHCESVSHPTLESTPNAFTPAASSSFTRNIVPMGTRLPANCVRLFMGQLRKDQTEEAVLFLLEQTVPHITLLRVQPHTNPNTGRGKGCAWVYVASESDAQAVLKLHKRAFFDCSSMSEEKKANDATSFTAAKKTLITPTPNPQKALRNASEGIWVSSSVFSSPSSSSPLTPEEEQFFTEMADCRAFVSRRPTALPRRAVVVEVPQSAEKSLTGIVPREGHYQQQLPRPFAPHRNTNSQFVPKSNYYSAQNNHHLVHNNYTSASAYPVVVNASFATSDIIESSKTFTADGKHFTYNPYGNAVTKRVASSASSSTPVYGASEDITESECGSLDDDRISMCAEAATSRQISTADWLFVEGTLVAE